MPPGLPGALFVAVALTMPTTCYLLAQRLHHGPGRRGLWWRVAGLQGATCVAALALLASPTPETSAGNFASDTSPTAEPTPTGKGDRSRGYLAGRALATDQHHRGSPTPRPEALNAMARLHGRGQSPDFAEGFRLGYVAGLAETRRP